MRPDPVLRGSHSPLGHLLLHRLRSISPSPHLLPPTAFRIEYHASVAFDLIRKEIGRDDAILGHADNWVPLIPQLRYHSARHLRAFPASCTRRLQVRLQCRYRLERASHGLRAQQLLLSVFKQRPSRFLRGDALMPRQNRRYRFRCAPVRPFSARRPQDSTQRLGRQRRTSPVKHRVAVWTNRA